MRSPLRRAAFATLLLLGACTVEPSGPPAPTPVDFSAIDGWHTDATDAALAQFRRQCTRLASLRADEKLGGAGEAADAAGTPGAYRPACLAAAQLTATDAAGAQAFFEKWFAAYDAGDIRLGGTYEVEVAGNAARFGAYQVPVYARPADLLTVRAPDGRVVSGRRQDGVVVPYASRAEIDAGALAGHVPVLAWLKSPVDLFFLQLEGAGRVRLPDGHVIRLGYAGQNGQAGEPIGRILVEHGLVAEGEETQAHIRAALAAHPEMIGQEPNYVFFKVLPDLPPDEGAPGTLGVPLAPLRSLAVDRSAVPLGLPIFYETRDASGATALAHLGFAEDTGSDLGGTNAADIFYGWGEAAAAKAGAPASTGHAVLLLPRPTVSPPS